MVYLGPGKLLEPALLGGPEDDIDMMDIDDDGVVKDIEFMRFMLVTMGKVSGEDWDKLQALFKRLDASNDGSLSIEDLKIMANQK